MKIAIVGKGTSAIISALHLIREGFDVEFFYDPDQKPLSVGESTTPHIQSLIFSTLNITIGDLADAGIVSYKNGIKYVNWGKGVPFRHHFHGGEVAFHFESSILNKFIHDHLENELLIKYHGERVEDYKIIDNQVIINEKVFDFIVNCAGWDDASEYYRPPFETVNSGILYTRESIDDPTYTLHTATEDGWEFGLPFPDRKLTKCGYLYHSNLSNPSIDGKRITWIPRYSKKLIQNRFEAYNGNRLFFFEPLEALSLLYYDQFAESIVTFLKNGRSSFTYQDLNNSYLQSISQYLTSVYWYYQYGSIYETSFWNSVRDRSSLYFNLKTPLNNFDALLNSYYMDQQLRDNSCDSFLKIGCFSSHDFKDVHSGMTQKSMKEHMKNIFKYPYIIPLQNDQNGVE